MYNLIQYSNDYSKTSGSLWQYYKDKPSLIDYGVINNFLGTSALFKTIQKLTEETGDTKPYVPNVTLLTQNLIKNQLLQQIISGFKRTINWNKYQSKVTIQGKTDI